MSWSIYSALQITRKSAKDFAIILVICEISFK